jgi:putative DNA primase/helicase
MLRALAEAEARQVQFLVPGLIPLRTITLVAGVGGLGKSTYLAGVAARVSRGELGDLGDVIFISYEDTTEEMLRPRVEAAGGDLRRVFDIVVPDNQGQVVLPSDLSELRECVRSVRARLVIIDPVVAAIDVNYDAHKDQHVRAVLAELAALAAEEEIAVAIVGHLNKAPSRDAYVRVANSVAFWNAARSVVLVTEDPEEPDAHCLVAQRKADFARLAPIERHRIETIILPDAVDPQTGTAIETSRMVFVEQAPDVDADDLLGPRERSDEKRTRAARFLAESLADGEWHDSAGLKKLAASLGVSERTLQRAAQEVDVQTDRRDFPSVTWWRLPQSRRVLSHSSGATVEPTETSGFESSQRPVAPVAQGNGTTGTTGARLGDDMFPVMLAEAVNTGTSPTQRPERVPPFTRRSPANDNRGPPRQPGHRAQPRRPARARLRAPRSRRDLPRCPVVALPEYSRPLIRVADYLAFLEQHTYDGRSRVR